MNRILKLGDYTVSVGTDDGRVAEFPRTCLNYDNPQINDDVAILGEGDNAVISLNSRSDPGNGGSQYSANEKHMNKHLFVWVGTFLFGGLGVDRFMRGQVGFGILKLITAGCLGIWSFVDFFCF